MSSFTKLLLVLAGAAAVVYIFAHPAHAGHDVHGWFTSALSFIGGLGGK